MTATAYAPTTPPTTERKQITLGQDDIRYSDEKMRELLIYIAESSEDDRHFGKTKLNKILYYIDFHAYASLGAPVTGATYQHRPYGPVPREIASARQGLFDSDSVERVFTESFGFSQERLVAKRPANLAIFSNDEKDIIDYELARLKPLTGVQVSELSHLDVGWKITKDRETISYSTVFLASRKMTADDVRRGQLAYEKVTGNQVA